MRDAVIKGFERYALELSKHMTIKDVAAHLGGELGYDKGKAA